MYHPEKSFSLTQKVCLLQYMYFCILISLKSFPRNFICPSGKWQNPLTRLENLLALGSWRGVSSHSKSRLNFLIIWQSILRWNWTVVSLTSIVNKSIKVYSSLTRVFFLRQVLHCTYVVHFLVKIQKKKLCVDSSKLGQGIKIMLVVTYNVASCNSTAGYQLQYSLVFPWFFKYIHV